MFDQGPIAGPLVVSPREHYKQRSSIHRAVVAPEWNLPKACHFPTSQFVQDFTRLSLALRINFSGLCLCEEFKYALSQRRVNPQSLESGNDPISAKHRAKPWHARIRVVFLAIANRHHLDVMSRSPNPVVKTRV